MSTASLSTPGTLVQARGREWVVLPASTDDILIVRPVGGLDEEVTGILPAVEAVGSATFRLPGKGDLGDFAGGRLLRDAARLSTRSAAGPFRSFGRIAIEPRPYQLVPLMMALKLDPVRMLIADDVGIGKTIEACLIARELLDRGEIRRIAVLCPPHLAEQWQRELAEKLPSRWFPPTSSRRSGVPRTSRSDVRISISWTRLTVVLSLAAPAAAGSSVMLCCGVSRQTRSAIWCWSPQRRTVGTSRRSVRS